jgi:hypothetical protein
VLELMVAATESTDFTFDPASLAEAASTGWPGARVVPLPPELATVCALSLDLPTADGGLGTELAVLSSRGAVSIETPSRQEAARVLAWLAQIAPLPGDGSVVVVHWTSEFYPLRPGTTAAQLLQDASS